MAPRKRSQSKTSLNFDARVNLRDKQVVLLLQGGGALGSYQVGAFEELARACESADNRIHWVAGISIGAINAAVIAAPKSGNAVHELTALWKEILSPNTPPSDYSALMKAWFPLAQQLPWLATLEDRYLGWDWTAFNPRGQEHFFSSRILNPLQNPWLLQWFLKLNPDQLAFYGTEALAKTLDKHVDWAKLAYTDGTRLSLGATRVCDGEVDYFHSSNCYARPSQHDRLRSDHVLASAALPPAFPPIQINDEWYFDGGVSNNTPIEILGEKLLNREPPFELLDPKKDIVVFLVDLWDRKNDVLPTSLDDVNWRQKCIQFGSRKKAAEIVVRLYQQKVQRMKAPHLDVCQIMLEHKDDECLFSFSDADFAQSTFERLYARGRADMGDMLRYDLYESKRVAENGRKLGGKFAALYRHGSENKWALSRDLPHRHVVSQRGRFPLAEAIVQYWQQFV